MAEIGSESKNERIISISESLTDVRLIVLISLALTLYAIIVGIHNAYGPGSIFGFSGSMLLALWPYFLFALSLVLGLLVLGSRWSIYVRDVLWGIYRWGTISGLVSWDYYTFLVFVFGFIHQCGIPLPALKSINPFWVLGHLALIGGLFLSCTKRFNLHKGVLFCFLVSGLLFWVLNYFPYVADYPLALSWSETSRYYYASLFLSPTIYGQWVPLSSLHPSRYLLQSLPFLISNLPLWGHRLWQVLLWFGMTYTAGFALAQRIKPVSRWIGFGLSTWFFLFTFQGPVYYHLMVVIIIVLFGFNKDKLWRTFFWVMLASLWAGISRVNWFPVPGMLAVALFVLEKPRGKKIFWQYWRWPVVTVIIGLIFAFLSQAVYAIISGNPPSVFASSISSPLFFYRLFPNQAFGLGILILTIIASLPLWIIFFWRVIPLKQAWDNLRLLALVCILASLMLAGFIVSIKIGGGNNLHNMDAFLVLLAVIAVYVAFNRFAPDNLTKMRFTPLPQSLMVLAFIIPLSFVYHGIHPYPELDQQQAWEDIRQVEKLIDEWVPEDGEVLFIQHRHLLTFDIIEGITLVPEYEKVFLMEMAMSENEEYLSNFLRDIESQRFSLIVTEPVGFAKRPPTEYFAEENNVWVKHVANPLAGSYYSILELRDTRIAILVPKPIP